MIDDKTRKVIQYLEREGIAGEMRRTSFWLNTCHVNTFHMERDLWSHTMLALSVACAMGEGVALELAALTHGLGKPHVRQTDLDKQIMRYDGWDRLSWYLAVRHLSSTGVSKEVIEMILPSLALLERLISVVRRHSGARSIRQGIHEVAEILYPFEPVQAFIAADLMVCEACGHMSVSDRLCRTAQKIADAIHHDGIWVFGMDKAERPDKPVHRMMVDIANDDIAKARFKSGNDHHWNQAEIVVPADAPFDDEMRERLLAFEVPDGRNIDSVRFVIQGKSRA